MIKFLLLVGDKVEYIENVREIFKKFLLEIVKVL